MVSEDSDGECIPRAASIRPQSCRYRPRQACRAKLHMKETVLRFVFWVSFMIRPATQTVEVEPFVLHA